VSDYREPLVEWHDELHDRFALPAALDLDLRRVLGDLDEHGLGIPAQLRRELECWRAPGITCRLGDATLTLRPALEFWPLVGDTASQERAGARIVDASTQRWEIAVDGPGPDRVFVFQEFDQLHYELENRLLRLIEKLEQKKDDGIWIARIAEDREEYRSDSSLHHSITPSLHHSSFSDA